METTVYNPLYNCGWKSFTLFKQQGKTYNNCIDNVLDNNIIIYYYNVYDVPFGLGFWMFYAVIYLYCSFSSWLTNHFAGGLFDLSVELI